jgi:hypothetical protein
MSAAAILFVINAAITIRLFAIAYTQHMGSIEAAYIGLGRYIREHFGQFNWFSLWYGGIPFQDAYPPVLPFLTAVLSAAGHTSPGLAYHLVTALLYSLTPAALFWAAYRLGASRNSAFAGALLYSLISPACWLSKQIRVESGGWFGPRRLTTLVPLGEGPHIASLLMLALAIGTMHIAIEKRRRIYYGLATLALAAVALSNWLGAFALALAVVSYCLAGFPGSWPRAAALAFCAYAVSLPWAPPSTIATIRANAPLVGGRFTPQPWLQGLFATTVLLLAYALKRLNLDRKVRFGLLFFFAMAFVTLGVLWFDQTLVPQPHRYTLEMDMAFWLAAALIIPKTPRVAVALLAIALAPLAVHQYRAAKRMEQRIDITSTIEYKVSRWLGENKPGGRVFAPGTIGFWMNAFSDTPMLTGGFDNGVRNTLLQHVNYQIYAGERREVALDWLKAFGCDVIVGGDPGSREVYHPIEHPEKFHGLRELWRDGADEIYEVPRGNRSLAHALRAADLLQQTPPAYDSTLLKKYLAAIDDPSQPEVRFEWRKSNAASITGSFQADQLISVQVTWDQGWRARVNGESRRLWADPIGQMVIEPHCAGSCTIDLIYDGGVEMLLVRLVCVLTLCAGAAWIGLELRRGKTETIRGPD